MTCFKLLKTKDTSFNNDVELYLKMKYRLNCKYLGDHIFNFKQEKKNLILISQYYKKKYKVPKGYYIVLNRLCPNFITDKIIEYVPFNKYFD